MKRLGLRAGIESTREFTDVLDKKLEDRQATVCTRLDNPDEVVEPTTAQLEDTYVGKAIFGIEEEEPETCTADVEIPAV